MEANYSIAPPAEVGSVARPGFLLQKVHLLYRNQFRTWFGITAPTSLVTAAVLLLADRQIKTMFGGISRHGFQYHWTELAGAIAIRFGGFFLGWMLGCFALAAIATVVSGLDDSDSDAPWRTDIHQRAREHLGQLTVLAVITFFAFLAGGAVAEFIETAIRRVVGSDHFSRFLYPATLVGLVVVASIVSWLGMAIPLILRGNIGVWAVLKRSVQLSSGYEGALFLLIVESLVGSYLAWYATVYGLRLLFPVHLRYAPWYSWVLTFVAALASAAVEPPLFIGISLLADPELFHASSLPVSEQAANID
jgi:hypothetical protein